MTNPHTNERRARAHLVGCLALLAGVAGCADVGPGLGPDVTARDGDMQAHFEASGSLDTSCGTTTGVRVGAKGPGDETTGCEADWYGYDTPSGHKYIADCFFVVEPGEWSFTELSAINAEGDALTCCTSTLPDDVTVGEGETTEVGGTITCDAEGNGALDVFATINKPPTIVDVEITPSKFGTTCTAIGLEVEAVDSEGETITYTWEVVSAEVGAQYSLKADGHVAAFASKTLGDYEVRVTAKDELGASASLDFPLHIIGDGGTECDTERVCLLYLGLEL